MGSANVPTTLLKKCVQLFKIENQCSDIKDQLKELNKERKKLNEEIMQEMKTLDFKSIETDMGTIHRQSFKHKQSINEKFLKNALLDMYKDSNKANELRSKIMNTRKTEMKERIKISHTDE